eukprot:4641684-Pleurochrysis_carterae.AAC.1
MSPAVTSPTATRRATSPTAMRRATSTTTTEMISTKRTARTSWTTSWRATPLARGRPPRLPHVV